MTSYLPNEGETFIANMVIKNITTDRGSNLSLRLFTNSSVSESTAAADLTYPSGGGYSHITLTDSSWTVSGDTASYAQQTFTATGGNMTGTIYGYAIVTTGTASRIIALETEPSGSFTLLENDTYKITPTIRVA